MMLVRLLVCVALCGASASARRSTRRSGSSSAATAAAAAATRALLTRRAGLFGRRSSGLLPHDHRGVAPVLNPRFLAIQGAQSAGMPDGCNARANIPNCFRELLTCAAAFFKKEIGDHWRLDGGTLIGQQRGTNKGWIPWDDDVDVTVDTFHMPGQILDYNWPTKFKNAKGCVCVATVVLHGVWAPFGVHAVCVRVAGWRGLDEDAGVKVLVESGVGVGVGGGIVDEVLEPLLDPSL